MPLRFRLDRAGSLSLWILQEEMFILMGKALFHLYGCGFAVKWRLDKRLTNSQSSCLSASDLRYLNQAQEKIRPGGWRMSNWLDGATDTKASLLTWANDFIPSNLSNPFCIRGTRVMKEELQPRGIEVEWWKSLTYVIMSSLN
ncbi:hypothetical protein Tco_1147485, partial [Tanacetum coccineum]